MEDSEFKTDTGKQKPCGRSAVARGEQGPSDRSRRAETRILRLWMPVSACVDRTEANEAESINFQVKHDPLNGIPLTVKKQVRHSSAQISFTAWRNHRETCGSSAVPKQAQPTRERCARMRKSAMFRHPDLPGTPAGKQRAADILKRRPAASPGRRGRRSGVLPHQRCACQSGKCWPRARRPPCPCRAPPPCGRDFRRRRWR